MNVTQIIAKLRQMYPGRIWKYESPRQPGRCQQMNWNVVYILLGYTRDDQMITYPSATAAYNASKIASKDPSKAQPGDIHFWAQPHPWGHTAVDVGGGEVLMASSRVGGEDGLGTIGTTEYTRATGATYLGWSKAVGKNPSIRGKITTDEGKTTPDAKKSKSEIVGSVLTNADTVIKAAKDVGLDLAVAAAVIEKESRGKNIFGHDRGGAYYGAGEVTEAKYKDFIKQVRAGKTSNGVGPAQITWPGFFTEMEKQGLKPWVPYDNMKYGFSLVKSYLNGSLSDAAIRQAGKRYNGNASYGDDLLAKVKQWRTRLGSTSSSGSTASAGRTRWEASDFGIGTNATKAQWKVIQRWLKKLGRYDGPADGIPGRETWKGIQRTVAKYKLYNGPVDGEPGHWTAVGMQKYAKNGGGYRGPADGKLGPKSWAGFVKRISS